MRELIFMLIGFLIGRLYSYYKNRIQCVNCGSNNTYKSADGYGRVKGSKCDFTVKHWEGHVCKSCGEITSLSMKL